MEHDQQLTVRDLLKRPIFSQAHLAAGKKGLSRPVGWVHILEITSATPFTNPNDLILSTGLGFRQHEHKRMKYLKELVHKGAAGLCVELGPSLPYVEEDMIAYADQHDFPLIVFETPVRFVDITQDIHSLLINRQYQVLRDLETFSRKLQQLTVESSNIQSVLRLLHEATFSQVVYYSLIDKHAFAPSVSPSVAHDLTQWYGARLEEGRLHNQETVAIPLQEKRLLVSQPVICLGQTLSHVGIILHDRQPGEYQLLLLDHVGKALANILLRKLFIEQKTVESHAQIINDILEYKVVNEERALARLGLHPPTFGGYLYLAGIVEIGHSHLADDAKEIEVDNQDTLVLLRSLLSKNGLFSLLLSKNNQIYVLCIREASESAGEAALKGLVQKTLDQLRKSSTQFVSRTTSLLFGFGQPKRKLTDVAQCFKEAFDTLSVARALPDANTNPFYEDLGIYQLFKGITDVAHLKSFVEHHLGPVIEYDRLHRSPLLKTLDCYLACMGAKQETAERLFIHRQTLYHRLERLEEMLGEDYMRPERRICLEAALRAYELLNSTG